MAAQDEQSVSVALCTHNGAAYVAQQVRSILRQRPAPLELVVGDDASTDETVAEIERVHHEERAVDPNLPTELRVIRRAPALGVVRNVESTIGACRGALIALSDQDDIWPEGRLAALAEPFASDPELLLVHSDARLVDDRGQPLRFSLLESLEATPAERASLEEGDGLGTLLRRNLVTGATVVFRARLRQSAIPFPDDWVHDEWLGIIAAVVGRVRLIPRPLLDYRQHGANQIGAARPTAGDRWRKLREPRAGRSAWLVRRAEELASRGRSLGVPYEVQAELEAKAAHEARRARLPRPAIARIPGILAGLAGGGYGRYSRGAIDVLRDLLAPAGDPADAHPGAQAFHLTSGRR